MHKKTIDLWMKNVDPATRSEIEKMSDAELEYAFGSEIQFTTAGIRGKMGPGPNQINIYTVISTAIGYAKFLKNKYQGKISVVIGTDNRYNHQYFANAVATILRQEGINVYLNLIIPTPFVSFAIRKLQAQGGIIITASHNAKEFNGLKAYNEHGAQLLPEDCNHITHFAKEAQQQIFKPLVVLENTQSIPKEIYDKYFDAINSLGKKYCSGENTKLKIVFTPQHGTASLFMPKILINQGHEIISVNEQMNHDPNFSHTSSTNPEDIKAYELAQRYAKEYDADIILSTDPDADRLGVMVKDDKDNYQLLTGNELGTLLFDYLLNKVTGNNNYIVSSIVSSPICNKMAKANNIKYYSVPTGFKWIADEIQHHPTEKLLFAFEESLGYLLDANVARDKDSFQTAVVVCQMLKSLKTSGETVQTKLQEIYHKYGFEVDLASSINFDVEDGKSKMHKAILEIKNTQFEPIAKVIEFSDHAKYNGLVQLKVSDNLSFFVRPSGTEPKMKIYGLGSTPYEERVEEFKHVMLYFIKQMEEVINKWKY